MDPYTVLGVETHASDEAIRTAYLRLVREHPPERSPKHFAEIQAAYDHLRDPAKRLGSLLDEPSPASSVDDLIRETADGLLDRRLPTDVLLSLEDEG